MIPGRRTSGVTLPVLLVGLVLGGVLAGAIYQVLVANQRAANAQRQHLLNRQALGAAVDLLRQELRETSASGGDLLSIGTDSVVLRSYRGYGLSCEVLSGDPLQLLVAYQGVPFGAEESALLLVERDPQTPERDHWYPVSVTDVTDGGACGDERLPAQVVALSGGPVEGVAPGSVQGTVLRSWDAVTYGVARPRGRPYLVRERAGHRVSLVGPLSGEDGFRLTYIDSMGDPTMEPTRVATVRISLKMAPEGAFERPTPGDSLTASVFLRN